MGNRSFPPGYFLLELDGAPAGYARNVQGGGAVAEVIREKVGTDLVAHKHVGSVSYEDIVVSCDAGLSKAFYDWVGQASGSQFARKDGAVVVFDGNKEISRLEWKRGLIGGIYFPALDAAAQDWFSIQVKIRPEFTRSGKGSGGRPATVARKSSLASAFRLTIEGLEAACAHVSRIEPIALEWRAVKRAVGEMRDYELEPGMADPSNLVINLPESAAKGFYDWFEDFVVKGNSGQDREKRGTLEAGPFLLQFGNLGVSAISRPSGMAGAARKIQVEMYCESIRFSAKAAG